MTTISVVLYYISNNKMTTMKISESQKLYIIWKLFYCFTCFKHKLIVFKGWLQNSELFLQTYPLWHLIISDNHVFDCFPLISYNYCRYPATQYRYIYEGLTVILFKAHTTSSV